MLLNWGSQIYKYLIRLNSLQEEEHGAMKALGKPQAKFEAIKEAKKQKAWPTDVSMKKYLEHLNVTKSWEQTLIFTLSKCTYFFYIQILV